MINMLKNYWTLIKSLQTGLLLITGLAGYMSVKCPVLNIYQLLILAGILFLTISGSTVLNMWYDRDIDFKMKRTCRRPLPSKKIKPSDALALGLILSIIGTGLAFSLSILFGFVIFAGLFFDVVVYTFLLKRRTAWSIVIGGISGGMPVLAGRVLGLGSIDWIGILLAASILFWIPTHILTFNMKYFDDYKNAGVPTIVSVYGLNINRKIIILSSFLSAVSLIISSYAIGINVGPLRLIGTLAGGMLIIAIFALLKPSEKLNYGMFKYASILMLTVMLIFIFEGF
jgi:heme o synthase